MELHIAPMQGYFDDVYLICHKTVYGGNAPCYTPFIRLENGMPRRQDINRLKHSINNGINITPQIIFNSEKEFRALALAIKELGCRRINLNMGCPYPMQTKKGRGSSMISNIPEMEKIAGIISEDKDTAYSVKMRLGLESKDEWRPMIDLLGRMPLSHITIHPRTATQMYDGDLDYDSFAEILERSAHPVIFNGEIKTIRDVQSIAERFPSARGIMIGRGLLARPSLLNEIRDGKEQEAADRIESLIRFHDIMLSSYEASLCGNMQILQKIKPFWQYLEPEIGRKAFKAINKAASLEKYRLAVQSLY